MCLSDKELVFLARIKRCGSEVADHTTLTIKVKNVMEVKSERRLTNVGDCFYSFFVKIVSRIENISASTS